LHLIAALDLTWLWGIAQVAIGLGMVIFVHELGHFAVAKLCGVKCEKFYLGFDIYGLKLARFRWGETEYGIGILPLGGYVKMLGQDDNPTKAAEERERTKLPADVAEASTAKAAEAETVGPSGERIDPRSYTAQSVPRRMAIISAGVIMNVIFAVLAAIVAYKIGVDDQACAVSAVWPGDAAWRAGLQPGDKIIAIEGWPEDQQLRFRDLITAVALSDLEEGVKFKIERKGTPEPFWLAMKPDSAQTRSRLAPSIGAVSPLINKLQPKKPAMPGTRADREERFQGGDTLVSIDGQPVEEYVDVIGHFARKRDKKLSVEVLRETDKRSQRVTIPLAPEPRRDLGLVMRMGPITSVQANSPADRAGLRPGDRIATIDGQPPGDPITLADRMRRKVGKTIALEIRRPGESSRLKKRLTVRDAGWFEESLPPGSPMSSPELGIAYEVPATVERVVSGSPAARATLRADEDTSSSSAVEFKQNDEIVKAAFKYSKDTPREQRSSLKQMEFSATKRNWPAFVNYLQVLPAGTIVTLTLADGRSAALVTAESAEWFNPDRGLLFAPWETQIKARTLGQATHLALSETRDMLTQVFGFLQKIFSKQISPYGLAGPVAILGAAKGAADEGIADLLIFLTMLSANLAVINFLPIPLLDGGHMVFLLLEWIMGRPVSERVVVAFHYLGFIFIISLMLFVLSLDVGLISRYSQ